MKIMTKKVLLLTCMFVAFSLGVIGCGGGVVKPDQTPTPTSTDTPTPTSTDTPPPSPEKPEKAFELQGAFGDGKYEGEYSFHSSLIDPTTKEYIKDAQINICDENETILTLEQKNNSYGGTTKKIQAGKSYTVKVLIANKEKYTKQITIPSSKITFEQTTQDVEQWLKNSESTNFKLSWNNNHSTYYYHNCIQINALGTSWAKNEPNFSSSRILTVNLPHL